LTRPSGREDLHPKKSEVQAKTADKREKKKKEKKKKEKGKRKKEKKFEAPRKRAACERN
jgi:hypothetical protein